LTLESSVQRGQSEILTQHNQLYNFARRLCVTLNQPVLTSNLLDSLSNCLVFVVRALFHSSSGEEKSTTAVTGGDDDIDSDGEGDGGNAHAREGRAGANWVIQRLRGIGADSRGYRRFNVIKVFAALVTVEENESMLSPHLEQLIEVCIRSRISRAVNEETEMTSAAIQNQKDTKEAAGELLEAIEQRVGSSTFIGIYGEVQRRIESSKAEKKRRLAAEAVSDPASYAQRKAKHAEKKKESRKRKNERFAAVKGIKKKKQSTNSAIIYEE
jgi:U3 small nucleolar RNA-associated protein 20